MGDGIVGYEQPGADLGPPTKQRSYDNLIEYRRKAENIQAQEYSGAHEYALQIYAVSNVIDALSLC